MLTDFKYYFYIRKDTNSESQLHPIYLRLQSNGKRKAISIRKKVRVEDFDPDTQRIVKGSNREHINLSLSSISRKLERLAYQRYDDEVLSLADIIDELRDEKANTTIGDIFSEHNDKMKSLIGKEYANGTHVKFTAGLNHLKKYMKADYNTNDVLCREINAEFVEGLDYYFRNVADCSHNTTVKHMRAFKKIVLIAKRRGLTTGDPYRNYSKTIKRKTPTFLTDGELSKVRESRFDIERLENVRQLFLLACYTGLSYGDLMKLNKDDLIEEDDGQWFIVQPRTKTNEPCMVMILDKARDLLVKYLSGDLSKISNQKFNAYLKEVADLCGITKHLTVHVARHTFATTVTLSKGVPLETVQHMMGHKDLRSTQHYARVNTSKVKFEMSKINS